MELFQLRVESGGGRAFTPSRGSMVVLTHVALVVEPNAGAPNKKKRDDASERVTVLVSTGDTPPVALGTVSDAPGMEQFSIGGSGLCFGDEKRVEVRHTGSSGACVCLTGRIEETYEGEVTSSDDEEYYGEERGEDEEESEESEESEDSDDEELDDSEESEEDADVMETVERYAARAAAARKAMDEADSDDEDEDEDEESSEDDSEEEDDDDDSSSSDDEDESDSDDSDESDDSDALPGSKRKGVSSEQARRESKFEDAREAKRSKGNFGRSKSFRRK